MSMIGITGRVLSTVRSQGWWTPSEIGKQTGDATQDVQDGIDELRTIGLLERRHLGSNERGDLYAYRLCAEGLPLLHAVAGSQRS